MPSFSLARQPPAHKHRLIKKTNKHKHQRSAARNLQDCDLSEENTMPEITTPHKIVQGLKPLRQIAHMMRAIINRFKYSVDTHYICLLLLCKMREGVAERSCRLVCGCILLMAAKVHEYRVPKFVQLISWGEFAFSSEDLIRMEGQLLAYFNFKIPTVLNVANSRQIELQIKKIQTSFQNHFITTFQ